MNSEKLEQLKDESQQDMLDLSHPNLVMLAKVSKIENFCKPFVTKKLSVSTSHNMCSLPVKQRS
jgi:hypothetical protein